MRLSLKESRTMLLDATNLDRKSEIRGPNKMGAPSTAFRSGSQLVVPLTHLPSLAGEQNHWLLGRRVHRSNRTSLIEWYGPKPVHDPRSSRIGLGHDGGLVSAPDLKVRGSGSSNPRDRPIQNSHAKSPREKSVLHGRARLQPCRKLTLRHPATSSQRALAAEVRFPIL